MTTNDLIKDFNLQQRLYHDTEAPYPLPNDVEEVGRLNLQHHLFRYLLQSNYIAPVSPDAKRILDVGCGSGIWCQEVSQTFPEAQFYGIDISDVNKATVTMPNFTFVNGDILKGLPFPDDYFDFVYQRAVVTGIPANKWEFVCKELVRVVKPGGWVELLELQLDNNYAVDYDLNRKPSWLRYHELIHEILTLRGISPKEILKIPQHLGSSGMINLDKRKVIMPTGLGGGQLDQLFLLDALLALKSLEKYIIAMGKCTKEEFDHIVAHFKQESLENKVFTTMDVVCAQKPFL
ncbi:hypothetical protein K7432_012354 [Basidiobolus ranarum]|uniref:Methyltransferase domain-containing protein n=1 Tax=Basidiobolus ranarum TaxID=34480 RepID=A0ABR2VSE5_9FUNG